MCRKLGRPCIETKNSNDDSEYESYEETDEYYDDHDSEDSDDYLYHAMSRINLKQY